MSQLGSQVPRPGQRLVTDEGATFVVQSELGRGGMGVVYQAHDERLGRPVALKIGLSRDTAKRLKRFQREGEIAASLEHPGIVRVHSAGSIAGRPYLCFELVAHASTFSDVILSISVERRLELVAELGEALGYAHGRGVVHRDVKPENVLVDGGHARLTDFGVALASEQERLTNTGTTVGTPHYAAPEQLRDGHRVGPQADVWSLGVILYEALTGELPFKGESLLTLVAKISAGFFEPPGDLDFGVPPALEAVCLKSLEVEVEDRYANGSEFAADLRRALLGEPTEAVVRRRGRRGLWAGVALAALAVLVSVLGFARPWESKPEEVAASPGAASPGASLVQIGATPGGRGSWEERAEEALAAWAPERALAALEAAPGGSSAARPLRIRALLQQQRGGAALEEVLQLPPSARRSVFALQAMVHGAAASTALGVLTGEGTGPRDPEVVKWRFLAGAAQPVALAEMERDLRRLRRARLDTGELRSVLGHHRALAEFDWPVDGLWCLAEDSHRDARLPEAEAQLVGAKALFPDKSSEGVAFRLGLQRWLVPRLRFAMVRLDARRWRALAEAGIALQDSSAADELRLQVDACLAVNVDRFLPPPLPPEEEHFVTGSPWLPFRAKRVRFLQAVVELLQVQTLDTPAEVRQRQLLKARSLCPPFPADGSAWDPRNAQTHEVELLMTGHLVEVTRAWREAWAAPTRADMQAKLDVHDGLLKEAMAQIPAGGIRGDWRFRTSLLRAAILRHDPKGMLEATRGGWRLDRIDALEFVLRIESAFGQGDLAAARRAAKELREIAVPSSWEPTIHNQLLFLEDTPTDDVREVAEFAGGHPLPWYSGEGTRRLLKAGWRPGKPILPALGRE